MFVMFRGFESVVSFLLLCIGISKLYGEELSTTYDAESSTIPYFDSTIIETIQTESTDYDEFTESTVETSTLTATATIGTATEENWSWTTTEQPLEDEDEPEEWPRALNCTECKCGNYESPGKIVGGSNAAENAYPWMAALYYNNRFSCGGSLISDRYVITAAHCVLRLDSARFRIQLYVHNRTSPTTNSVERSVKAIKTYFYNILTNNNDIALMELTFPVTISSDRIVPICLPPANDNVFEGKLATVTGWGKTALGGISATLQELQVPVLSNSKCRRTGYWALQITNKMLCAGYVEGGRDSCQGDSGGPLQVYNNNTHRYELLGIVSWGRACAQKNYPGVYTRVSKFLRWINNNIKNSCTCS